MPLLQGSTFLIVIEVIRVKVEIAGVKVELPGIKGKCTYFFQVLFIEEIGKDVTDL